MNRLFYMQSKYRMASLAKGMGVAAIIISVMMPQFIIISLGLGFMAILFGFLSKGYEHSFEKTGKLAVTLGTVAIVINLLIGIYSFHSLITNPEVLNEVLNTANEMYGAEYTEMFGKDVNELFYDTFGDMINGQN